MVTPSAPPAPTTETGAGTGGSRVAASGFGWLLLYLLVAVQVSSWLRDRVPPASRFTDWVKVLFAIRGRPDVAMSAEQVEPIRDAIARA